MQRFRVRAPELLRDGEWFNTPLALSLAELRGRVVLLDFWTSGCVNCLHVIDELRALEAAYPTDLVVIGVHSPKFAHESTPASVAAAVGRYGLTHPVLSDPEMVLWRQYAVRAWPTLVLIDQDGYVVAQAAGEGQVSGLAMVVAELLDGRASVPAVSPAATTPRDPDALYFPAKAIVLPAARTGRDIDSLLVANSGAQDLLEVTSAAPHSLLRRIGSGARGRLDGPATAAEFAEPGGVALLPVDVAAVTGYDVVVADTVNHVLRGLRLSDGAVVHTIDLPTQLAGTRTITGPVPEVLSPWDVTWWPAAGRIVVAAAGVHLLLSVDPATDATEILAGTTVEGLRDGDPLDAWLAQPSGFAVDGDRLWFVDAETSALRYLDRAPADGRVTLGTAVGEGLFDFGHVDGPAATARLQHALDVTLLPDGSVALADTYNGAIRRYDPQADEVTTLAQRLAEPSGLLLVDGALLVVESAAHRLATVPLPTFAKVGGNGEADGDAPTMVTGDALRTQRPASPIAPGPVRLEVLFEVPPGRQLDDRDGPATRLSVSASPPELLVSGGGEGTDLARDLVLAEGFSEGVLHVSAQAASCDHDPEVEYPACHLARQDWGVPLSLAPGGPSELQLVLFG